MANLLIVDDDLDVAEVLTDVLSGLGHEVRTAPNGEAGLWELGERIPDVLLLDVEMPLLDGPGMAAEMFRRDHGLDDVPIILLSGIPTLPRLAARVGTPYFHAKPYSQEDVQALLERALSERARPIPHPEI